jgi:hypothetical protein
MKLTEQQKQIRRYRIFKKKYFKDRESFSGLELEECQRKFLEQDTKRK